MKRHKTPDPIERVVLEVAGGCNYTCKMCPQTTPGRGKSWTRKMSLKQFESIVDQIVPKYGHPQFNLEGSGDPTMAKDLDKYIEIVKKYNCKAYMYTNGARLHGNYMKRVVDAGIDFIRVSVIGYDTQTYRQWMDVDNFFTVKYNVMDLQDYIEQSGSNCEVSSYHLILNNSSTDVEIAMYRQNFIDPTGVTGYIWKMHNWSGNYKPNYGRDPSVRKTCGRPFAPEVTIRAGGIDLRTAAMTPCCQTLGPPNESLSVLGHLDEQSFEEVYFGEKYEELRKLHREERFDEIPYCKNCDFLYDDPEVLVWSNDSKAKTYHMLGTNFTLDKNVIVSC